MSGNTPRESATITLLHPIEANGVTVSSVAMRRPIVRDLRAAQRQAGSSPAEVELMMFSNLCELAPETLELMDLGDYRELQRAYEGFLSRGSTSAAPSGS